MMSGGPIRKFVEGWAVPVFKFGRAHYFKRQEIGLAKSLCNAVSVQTADLRGVGDWRKCKRCAAMVATEQGHLP